MNCRDVRDAGDSFLSEELLTETNHEILRHLDACPTCRVEIDGRRRLRRALQGAFDRASDLQPRAGFALQLRKQLREAANDGRRFDRRRWLALAAGVILVAGLTSVIVVNRQEALGDALARDARADHWNCALKNRLVRMPVPLEEAAQRFDSAYRLLITAPPDEFATPGGTARVVDRHSCAYGTRHFGHVILEYRGRVVSLLLTANDDPSSSPMRADSKPRLLGGSVDGLSVVSIHGARHAVLLVGDLDERELTRLSTAVSTPVAEALEQ